MLQTGNPLYLVKYTELDRAAGGIENNGYSCIFASEKCQKQKSFYKYGKLHLRPILEDIRKPQPAVLGLR